MPFYSHARVQMLEALETTACSVTSLFFGFFAAGFALAVLPFFLPFASITPGEFWNQYLYYAIMSPFVLGLVGCHIPIVRLPAHFPASNSARFSTISSQVMMVALTTKTASFWFYAKAHLAGLIVHYILVILLGHFWVSCAQATTSR